MKPAQYPDLKLLIDKLEKRNKQRQATRAILVGSFVLGGIALTAPFLVLHQSSVAVAPVKEIPPAPVEDAYAMVAVEGKSAIVYDLVTKEVLYQKNSKAQLPLASLTKLLTTYAGATTLAPDSQVTITASALAQDGESGLSQGEVFNFTDAAKLALVASSNDAAEAVAEAAAQKENGTNKSLLASAAAAIGLPQTYAVNGTGLDVSTSLSGGYGSAYDVAQLAGAVLEVAPELARATTYPSVTVYSKTGAVHTLPNTNQEVVRVPNLLLSKTGFTDLAGGNLAIVFDAGIGHPVAIVVLGSSHEGRFSDVARLLALTGAHFAGISGRTQTASVGNTAP